MTNNKYNKLEENDIHINYNDPDIKREICCLRTCAWIFVLTLVIPILFLICSSIYIIIDSYIYHNNNKHLIVPLIVMPLVFCCGMLPVVCMWFVRYINNSKFDIRDGKITFKEIIYQTYRYFFCCEYDFLIIP